MSEAIIPHDQLRDFVEGILSALAVAPAKARLVAETLVAANLRAVDSHGVQLLPFYVDQIECGRMNPHAQGRVVSESGACLVYDGENGVGQFIAELCSDHAVRLCREHGLGMVVARESNHFGAAAWWGQRISAHGMVGIVQCNASPMVAPWQGCDPRYGTNPLCVAVPSNGAGAWLLDMASTTVAMGRIYKAFVNREATIPPGWAMDGEGVPTVETETALNGLLMPLGGYKGSGLAMMAEILCGVLGGGAVSTELGGLRIKTAPFRVSQMFLAIDVARFIEPEQFQARMEKLVTMVKSSRPAQGHQEVLVAGDPEWRAEAGRLRGGIPVPENLWTSLGEIARRLGVAIPALG